MKSIKKYVAFVLALSLIFATPIFSKQVKADSYPARGEIIGKWYLGNAVYEWDPVVLTLKSDGTFTQYYKLDDKSTIELYKSKCVNYSYDANTGILTLNFAEKSDSGPYIRETKLRFKKSNKTGLIDVYHVNTNENDSYYCKASMNYYLMGKQYKKFKKSYDYYKIKAAKDYHGYNDFYVKKGVLIKYTGYKKKVKIPYFVKTIGTHAFAAMPGYTPKTKKLIVPGHCKTLNKQALSHSKINHLVLKEGVKTLKAESLAYQKWKKVYFPKSVKKFGKLLFYNEWSTKKTKLYVYYKSKAHKFVLKDHWRPSNIVLR